MTEQIAERVLYDGPLYGTFYALGSFGEFLRGVGARNTVFPSDYGNIDGGKGTWLTPDGLNIVYEARREPERVNVPGTGLSVTRWPGKVKISAFGLESKIDSFEGLMKGAKSLLKQNKTKQ